MDGATVRYLSQKKKSIWNFVLAHFSNSYLRRKYLKDYAYVCQIKTCESITAITTLFLSFFTD